MLFSKRKIYFIIIIIALIPLLYVFIIRPAQSNIKKIHLNVAAQKQILENLYSQGQFKNLAQEQYAKISSTREKLEKIFVNPEQELELITALEKIASQNNLTQEINISEPKEEKNKSQYQVTPLNLKINGNYKNLIKYLIALEELDYYINIKKLRIVGYPGGFIANETALEEGSIGALIDGNFFIKH